VCSRSYFCVVQELAVLISHCQSGINIDYRKSEAEQGMLMNLHKKGWTEGLKLTDFEKHKEGNEESVKVCLLMSHAIGNEIDRFDPI
jgi:26S proteasome regulatory subunit N11